MKHGQEKNLLDISVIKKKKKEDQPLLKLNDDRHIYLPWEPISSLLLTHLKNIRAENHVICIQFLNESPALINKHL